MNSYLHSRAAQRNPCHSIPSTGQGNIFNKFKGCEKPIDRRAEPDQHKDTS